MLTAAVAATRFAGDAIWPCPVSCTGGGHYQHLLGLPVHVPAVVMMLTIAGLAWTRRLSAAVTLAWIAAGASAYFLWLLWRLEMACGFCVTVHVGTWTTALLTLRLVPPAWWTKTSLAVIGFLGLHFIYHPGVVIDAPTAEIRTILPQPTTPMVDPDMVARIESRRRLGRSEAPQLLEIAVDLHCSRCADRHGPLLTALKPRITSGQVAVVNRFLFRPSTPTGRELAEHALTAPDATSFGLVVAVLIGTPEGRGWSAVQSRVAEVLTLPPASDSERLAITAVLAADTTRLGQLGCRQTPFALLSRSGVEVARWQGDQVDPAAILAAVDR